RIKLWRVTEGPAQEVYFGQKHVPGRLCASDFTHMTELGITLEGQTFEHLVYHFVLTYSNWETGTICYSESLESLSEGWQNAVWELGAVPFEHRTDSLSSAVNNMSNLEEFNQRDEAVMKYYGVKPRHTNPASPNENGDSEQSHHRFNPFSALFGENVYEISWLGASSAIFCHYNRRPDRIGSAPPEASDPDGPSEHAVGAARHSASAGPTLLRVGEY